MPTGAKIIQIIGKWIRRERHPEIWMCHYLLTEILPRLCTMSSGEDDFEAIAKLGVRLEREKDATAEK